VSLTVPESAFPAHKLLPEFNSRVSLLSTVLQVNPRLASTLETPSPPTTERAHPTALRPRPPHTSSRTLLPRADYLHLTRPTSFARSMLNTPAAPLHCESYSHCTAGPTFDTQGVHSEDESPAPTPAHLVRVAASQFSLPFISFTPFISFVTLTASAYFVIALLSSSSDPSLSAILSIFPSVAMLSV
jgi:hypothetical protein